MNRRRHDLQQCDMSLWPMVDLNALSPENKQVFQARYRALTLFAQGVAVRDIMRQTGIHTRQMYRLLERCMSQADDGALWGYRGLLKYLHLEPYHRTKPFPIQKLENDDGLSGAFASLLDRNRVLTDWITLKLRQHAVMLKQVSTEGTFKTRLSGLEKLHAGFLQQCRALGFTHGDYPFNTDRMGIRALSAFVKAELLHRFDDAAHAAGATRLKGMLRAEGSEARAIATRPYQIVEFDGHRLDVRLKIIIRDPLGYEQELEIERIWLLVILDVCTRAVLGYKLVLSREYSRYDVIKTIEQALTPISRATSLWPI